MILVTGTKRSGTSMWIQILAGAGLPVIGEAFPSEWGESIRDANPHGFYESRFRQGVFYATNPDPKTGHFVHPNATHRHAVKVFIPGLCRTDFAFLDRVIATIRDWRDYGGSLQRLYALEDAHLAKKGDTHVQKAHDNRSPLPPHIEWFLENYELIRDFSARRFPMRLYAYERLLAEPERIVSTVLEWVGGGNLQGALDAIDPSSRTHTGSAAPEGVDPAHAEVFDELYRTLHDEQPLEKALVDRLNALQKALIAEYGELSRDRGREA